MILNSSRENQTALLKSLFYIMSADGGMSIQDLKILQTVVSRMMRTFYSFEDAKDAQENMSYSSAVKIIKSFHSINQGEAKLFWAKAITNNGVVSSAKYQALKRLAYDAGIDISNI